MTIYIQVINGTISVYVWDAVPEYLDSVIEDTESEKFVETPGKVVPDSPSCIICMVLFSIGI